jgi:hypothetical protein
MGGVLVSSRASFWWGGCFVGLLNGVEGCGLRAQILEDNLTDCSIEWARSNPEFGYTAFILPAIKPPYLAESCRGRCNAYGYISPEATCLRSTCSDLFAKDGLDQ